MFCIQAIRQTRKRPPDASNCVETGLEQCKRRCVEDGCATDFTMATLEEVAGSRDSSNHESCDTEVFPPTPISHQVKVKPRLSRTLIAHFTS